MTDTERLKTGPDSQAPLERPLSARRQIMKIKQNHENYVFFVFFSNFSKRFMVPSGALGDFVRAGKALRRPRTVRLVSLRICSLARMASKGRSVMIGPDPKMMHFPENDDFYGFSIFSWIISATVLYQLPHTRLVGHSWCLERSPEGFPGPE